MTIENTTNLENMHVVMSLDIPQRTLERALERIGLLNKIKHEVQGWIVDYRHTDADGTLNKSGKHITGYFVNEGDSRHGQLITTSVVENKATLEGYKLLTTQGLNPKPYFLMEWEEETNE